ncbi:MAG: glycosyltransferase family 2 protein [Solobacterium sp.]|nr:glycosyltransferase family 2 protein [Solobacterium sp.]
MNHLENEDLISVIITVYNSQKYLKKCINSVLQQTYTSLDIILVNDGSTDGSDVICDEYAGKDSRIHVFHQKNLGVAETRNTGLKHANGSYILFVDSDDFIEPDMVEVLYTALKDNDVQMSICGYRTETESGEIIYPEERNRKTYSGLFTSTEILRDHYPQPYAYKRYWVYLWNKLIARELFDGIWFPKGRLYEDFYVMPQIYSRMDKCVCIPDSYYMYIQRPGSIMDTHYRTDQSDYIIGLFSMAELYSASTELQSIAYEWLVSGIGLYKSFYCSMPEYRDRNTVEEIKHWFRKEYRNIKKSIIPLKQRLYLTVHYLFFESCCKLSLRKANG